MPPTSLYSTVNIWVEKGIADFVWGDVILTPEFREWMYENLQERYGMKRWAWDHFREEHEVAIYFTDPKDAVLFKLVWL